jgi:transcriptional regulator with XRE-family HTH domain
MPDQRISRRPRPLREDRNGHTQQQEQRVFGRTIRELRRSADISQEALAAIAGMGAKHLGEIERGKHDPRFTTMLKLARALQLEPGELIAEYERAVTLPLLATKRSADDRAA